MAKPVPEALRDIFEKNPIAHLATIMPDGSPQVTPVWLEYDGTHVLINSTKGRRKDLNMRRDPRVSLSMCDPDKSGRYLEIRGTVVEITEDGAERHLDVLSERYLGEPVYPFRVPGEVRVLYKIAPERFSFMG